MQKKKKKIVYTKYQMCGTENCIIGIQSRIYWCRLVYLGKISKRRQDFKLFLKKG